MLIGKTIIDHEPLKSIGTHLYGTRRTHENDLVALQYMIDDEVTPFDAVRNSNFCSLIKYTFCWIMEPAKIYKYMARGLEIQIKRVINEDGYVAFVCFFTADIKIWSRFCFNESLDQTARDEVKDCLSADGYALLFKDVKLLKG